MQTLQAGFEAVKSRVNKNDELLQRGSGPINASPSSSSALIFIVLDAPD